MSKFFNLCSIQSTKVENGMKTDVCRNSCQHSNKTVITRSENQIFDFPEWFLKLGFVFLNDATLDSF